jgi:hypothetical protein
MLLVVVGCLVGFAEDNDDCRRFKTLLDFVGYPSSPGVCGIECIHPNVLLFNIYHIFNVSSYAHLLLYSAFIGITQQLHDALASRLLQIYFQIPYTT